MDKWLVNYCRIFQNPLVPSLAISLSPNCMHAVVTMSINRLSVNRLSFKNSSMIDKEQREKLNNPEITIKKMVCGAP